jgi:tRNA(Ile)-lysidine synthase
MLASRFAELEALSCKPSRYVIAFSGGLDSSVLTHCIATMVAEQVLESRVPVVVIHVDHGLHEDSAAWSVHCAHFASDLAVEFQSLRVTVPTTTGKGLEAAAREVRYATLSRQLQPGDWLLSAHHREDQSETLLMNLIRGSGPAGLAGIGAARPIAAGWLVRPLLDVDQAALKEYATKASLQWLEDPSNIDRRFDRNFLRHEVLPQFCKRWPNVGKRLQRSVAHAGEAAELLIELARIDLEALGSDVSRLPADGLSALSPARQRNMLRFAVRELGLPMPPAQQLESIVRDVIPARVDAMPLVSWPGGAMRRYRNTLYCLPDDLAAGIESHARIDRELVLGTGLGRLQLVENAEIGLSKERVDAGLTIKSRIGGEKIKPLGQLHTRKLKKLLQEEGIVPWMRDRLPLVYCGEQLVAVGDLWMAADAVSKPGVGLRWIDRPALH